MYESVYIIPCLCERKIERQQKNELPGVFLRLKTMYTKTSISFSPPVA